MPTSVFAALGVLVTLGAVAFGYGMVTLHPKRPGNGSSAGRTSSDLADVQRPRNRTPPSGQLLKAADKEVRL